MRRSGAEGGEVYGGEIEVERGVADSYCENVRAVWAHVFVFEGWVRGCVGWCS